MTHREVLLNGIHLKPTSRLPVIILSSGVWTYYRYQMSLQDAFDFPPELVADRLIRNNEELGADLMWMAADCNNIALRAIGAECTFNIPGAAATVDKPLISTPSDVDKLNISDLENSREIENLLKTTRIVADRVGGEYLICVSQWGPFTLAGQLMGTEKFMITTLRDKEGTKHVLEFASQLVLKYWNLFIDAGVELVCQAEPSSSGDMISPKMFENLAMPYIRAANDAIGSRVQAKMLHICGNTTKILDLIPQTGTNLFSFDYKVDLKTVREKLGGKVAFAGNLDPVSALLEGTPESIEAAAKQCISDAGLSDGYVLMPGCDVAPKTSLENVQAMIKTAHQTLM